MKKKLSELKKQQFAEITVNIDPKDMEAFRKMMDEIFGQIQYPHWTN